MIINLLVPPLEDTDREQITFRDNTDDPRTLVQAVQDYLVGVQLPKRCTLRAAPWTKELAIATGLINLAVWEHNVPRGFWDLAAQLPEQGITSELAQQFVSDVLHMSYDEIAENFTLEEG